HAHPLRHELLVHRVGNRSRERLEQLEAAGVVDGMDGVAHPAVVGRREELVCDGLGDLERDVDVEGLTLPAFLLARAVMPEQLDPVYLDDHSAPAAATVSASTCARTSCTRRIVAPRS